MLTCREATALATDAADGVLPLGRRLAYWMHLALCRACRRYREQMELTWAVLKRFVSPASQVQISPSVREELERMQKERSGCQATIATRSLRRWTPKIPRGEGRSYDGAAGKQFADQAKSRG